MKHETKHDTLNQIQQWFKDAKPNPTLEDACVQIGCHYEEVAEMAAALLDKTIEAELVQDAENYKSRERSYICELECLSLNKKTELLDALCDQIVTAIGVANMLGMDIEGALKEVADSNDSKREDGKFIFDESGKIKKGKDYFAPKLDKFVG